MMLPALPLQATATLPALPESACAAALQVTLVGPSNEARIIYPDLATCKGYIHGATYLSETSIQVCLRRMLGGLCRT